MVTIKVENVISWSISSISGDQHSAGIMLAVAEASLSPSVMHQLLVCLLSWLMCVSLLPMVSSWLQAILIWSS